MYCVHVTSLAGGIINIESLDVKFSSWKGSVNPDESFWFESARNITFFLTTFRIFHRMSGGNGNAAIGETCQNMSQ